MMNHIKHLDGLYHRIISLNTKAKLPNEMEKFLKLNPLDQTIMNIIIENDSITISNLTKLLKKSKSTMTSAIKRLEDKGLIERDQYQKDKRIFYLSLTEKGIELQKSHYKFENELFTQIISALNNEEDRSKFLELLEKIIKEFEKKYEGE